MASDKDKVNCRTPTPGKSPTQIDRWKFDAVKNAILKSLPKSGDGVLFQKLPELVASHLSADEIKRLGAVRWYTTTVKLELEVQGLVKRVANQSPQRLLRGD